MYSDNIDKICAYCANSEFATGLTGHIYCQKKKEYRKKATDACSDYAYDILKRPVRRKKKIDFSFSHNDFSI